MCSSDLVNLSYQAVGIQSLIGEQNRRFDRTSRCTAIAGALIALISSMADIPAAIVFGFATGNISRMRKLDQGLIEIGHPADFVFMDKAQHSAGADMLSSIELGDIPGIGMVMIDGLVKAQRSRNTPPADRVPVILPS